MRLGQRIDDPDRDGEPKSLQDGDSGDGFTTTLHAIRALPALT